MMTKQIRIGAAALLTGILLTACDANNPENPKNEAFVPTIAQELLGKKPADAGKLLTQKEFAVVEGETDETGGSYVYPASMLKDAQSETKTNASEEYIALTYGVQSGDTVSFVQAEQGVKSGAEYNMFLKWDETTNGQFSNASIWTGYITSGQEQTFYMGGALIDAMRPQLLAMLETMYKAGQMPEEVYQASKEMYTNTREDFLKDLKDFRVVDRNTAAEVIIKADNLQAANLQQLTAGKLEGTMVNLTMIPGTLFYVTLTGDLSQYAGEFLGGAAGEDYGNAPAAARRLFGLQ